MCDPVSLTALSIGVSVAGTGASLFGQAQAAQAQREANEASIQTIEAQGKLSRDALEARRDEEEAATTSQLFDLDRETARARARARVAAGEAGVSGLSVEALERDLGFQGLEGRSRISEGFDNVSEQIDRQIEGTWYGQKAQIESLPSVVGPDYLGAAIGLAGTATSALSGLRIPKRGQYTSPTPNPHTR